VSSTDLVTPVSSTDRDDRELGKDDGTTDGSGDFLGALNTETDMAIAVTNNDEGLETGSLTSTGLLLDWHDLEDFILQLGGGEEVVNDLVFLDWEREEVDVFEALDESLLDKTSKLGNGDPVTSLFLFSGSSSSTSSATSTVSTVSSAFSTTITESSTASTTSTATTASTSKTTSSTTGRIAVSHLLL